MDPVALLFPVGGIGLILIVVWLTGGLRGARIADAEAARRQVALDWPEFQPDQVLVDRDERSALIASADGAQLAALSVVGSEIACRLVSPTDVTNCRTAGERLIVKFRDLGITPLALALGDAAAAEAWRRRIEAWRGGGGLLDATS